MDINTIGLAIFGLLFFAFCWGAKKASNSILDIVNDIENRYECLAREMKKQQDDLLRVKSDIIAMEYYKQKPQREPRNARHDIRHENEVEET